MVTKKLDVRTGEAIWTDYRKPRIPVHALSGNLDTDVLIVGAGISGAMMAEAIAGQGLDVVIADKARPLSGSTAATTALTQFEIDVPLVHLIKKIGLIKASSVWRRSRLALESLSVKIRDLQIDCGYERRDSLYLNGDVLNPGALEEECLQRNMIGLSGRMVYTKHLRDLYGISAAAAILSRDNISCNPLQLSAGILNAALDKGAKLYSYAEICSLDEKRSGWSASTKEGTSINAKIVIFATGYEIPDYVRARKHQIKSTWAISAKPAKRMPDDMPFVWQASDPYIYGRVYDGRMIFGGEDEDFKDPEKRDALLPRKQETLLRKLHHLLPDNHFELEHAWTGSFGSGINGLPTIGEIPGKKNCYVVMAYGGNGITYSRIAAEIISAKIFGYKDPDEELFAF